MAWIEMAACTSHVRLCMWSGFATDARQDSETGQLKCPKCRSRVQTWKVDQDKEMAALRQERKVEQEEWLARAHQKEDMLKAQSIASDNAKMRIRATVEVAERRGWTHEREERQHFRELIARAIAAREDQSDG
jgi:hypothetical protein